MNIKLPVIIAFIGLIAITSCKKVVDVAPDDSLTTDLNVINATADTLNYYVNGSRINNLSSLYPLGYSGYTGVAGGQERVYQFKKPRSPIVLFEMPLALDTNKNYSLFLGGLSAEQSFTVLDTLTADTGGRPKIRFVNVSPEANLDVFVGDTVNFKARQFKTATVFLPVNAGTKRIRVYKNGTTTNPLIDETRILLSGRIYTLFSKGTVNGRGSSALGTGLVVNR
jgi:hypothetical protein